SATFVRGWNVGHRRCRSTAKTGVCHFEAAEARLVGTRAARPEGNLSGNGDAESQHMKLIVIRHGAAMDREEFARTGASDDLRPLTAEGENELGRAVNGLRGEVRALSVLATSPLVRARQTAEIVANAFGRGSPEIT